MIFGLTNKDRKHAQQRRLREAAFHGRVVFAWIPRRMKNGRWVWLEPCMHYPRVNIYFKEVELGHFYRDYEYSPIRNPEFVSRKEEGLSYLCSYYSSGKIVEDRKRILDFYERHKELYP
jgi:hypothetical protein